MHNITHIPNRLLYICSSIYNTRKEPPPPRLTDRKHTGCTYNVYETWPSLQAERGWGEVQGGHDPNIPKKDRNNMKPPFQNLGSSSEATSEVEFMLDEIVYT